MLDHVFKRLITVGRLDVVDHTGRRRIFDSGQPGPAVTIRLADRATVWRIAFNPKLALGEAYMDGRLTIEDGDLYAFLDLCARNLGQPTDLPFQSSWSLVSRMTRHMHMYNTVGRARANVAHHYNLSDTLYDLFLDRDRQYSCAYFASDNDSLEIAQDNKKRHIAAKLLLAPGQRVLDIGSGWGGMGLYLAEVADCDVTGVTLSEEQYKVSNQRAVDAGRAARVRFKLLDYRQEDAQYDRIVSVGMFEHVGASHYLEFFRKVSQLLNPDGVMLLHSIGRMDSPGGTNPWLRKYIFPGGYTPALSETMSALERAGLWVTDIEILRMHYAKTLREWRRRFNANREKIEQIYDAHFGRMWDFYLAGCEVAFRHMGQMVFQMQIARDQEAVPLTRDYMQDWERKHMHNRVMASQSIA